MDRQSQKSCIITGGSGFIGSHLVDYLLDNKIYSKIYILDINKPSNISMGMEYIKADISQPLSVDLPSDCETCYHLAALCKEPGYEWDEYFLTNHVGTRNVCALADRLNIRNMIFTSTMMVFRAGDERNHEESLTAPDTAYGMSKLLAEQVLLEWLAKSTDRRLRIVRPGVVFGRGESANYTRLYYALKKNRFFFIGRKSTIKGSIYVKDLVRFLDFVTSDSSDRVTYNLAYPVPLTIEDICKTICEVFGLSTRIPVFPYRIALFAGYLFEFLAGLGVKTDIHHRRIQKLFQSTDIAADAMMRSGFRIQYNMEEALEDWKNDCFPNDLY